MIILLKYGLTKNLGNCEAERIDAEYQVAEGECAVTALASLKKFVTTGVLVDTSKVEAPKVEAPKVEAPKVEAPKVEAPKVEAPKVEAPKVEAPKVEAPKVEAPAKKKAPAKAVVAKDVPYSREKKEHKATLAVVLGDKYPTWSKDPELKVKALEASLALEGVPVMDSKGTVLDSFKEKVVELMEGPSL